jgi:predicted XRE-type DNA-binding protein
MPTTLKDKLNSLPPERRNKIEERTEELLAQEMSLTQLRKAHNLAQEQIASALGIGQEAVSRLEKRSDLLISTLRSYIEAMGGNLSLIAEFPGTPPVNLTGLANMETHPMRSVTESSTQDRTGRKRRPPTPSRA